MSASRPSALSQCSLSWVVGGIASSVPHTAGTGVLDGKTTPLGDEQVRRVVVVGLRSLVGGFLAPILAKHVWEIYPWGRSGPERELPAQLSHWVFLTPLWEVPSYLTQLERLGARRVVALSSTSVLSKVASGYAADQSVVQRLAAAEDLLQQWARNRQIAVVILRPTMIYGAGTDQNVCEIDRLIRRFGGFVVVGGGRGLRQPVHAQDVAWACATVLESTRVAGQTYNIGGGERLEYRELVTRVFKARSCPVRVLALPTWIGKGLIALVRLWPRWCHWHGGMVERMSRDLVADNQSACRDFGYDPRPFSLTEEDLPPLS